MWCTESLRSNVSSSEANALGMVANLDDTRKRLYTTEKQLKAAEKQAQIYKDAISSSKKSLGLVMGRLDDALSEKKLEVEKDSKEKVKSEVKKESDASKEKDSKSIKEEKWLLGNNLFVSNLMSQNGCCICWCL